MIVQCLAVLSYARLCPITLPNLCRLKMSFSVALPGPLGCRLVVTSSPICCRFKRLPDSLQAGLALVLCSTLMVRFQQLYSLWLLLLCQSFSAIKVAQLPNTLSHGTIEKMLLIVLFKPFSDLGHFYRQF